MPSVYDTPLSTPDSDAWSGGPPPGARLRDAPLQTAEGEPTFLTDAFTTGGRDFTLLHAVNGSALQPPDGVGLISIGPQAELARCRRACSRSATTPTPGTAYLLRPDGYVAARFRHPTRAALDAALARASGRQ